MKDIEQIYEDLRVKFDMQGNYFYPLSETNYKHTLVYDEDTFNEEDKSANYPNLITLIDLLKNLNINNIICNSIYDEGLHKTTVSEIWLGVGDVYYFDKKLDWVIYVSHEGTITFAGEILVNKVLNTFGDSYIATDWV